MADRPLRLRSDDELEAALRRFADEIVWPVAVPPSGDGPDIAASVRARIEAPPRAGVGSGAEPGGGVSRVPTGPRWNWWPARRALIAAVIILLALAIIAGAAGLGLPGLRLILGPAPVSPPPSIEPNSSPAASGALPGSTLGLGEQVPLDRLDARAGFTVAWPSDPAVGVPDAAYVDASLGGQVALVWRSRDGLPDTLKPGVGLVLTEFRGLIDSGFYSKAIGTGTTATPVLVHGGRAFWLTGDPHFLFYTGPDGFIHEERRWIGDTLIWARGPITYRLETSLAQDAAIRIAESMP
jgi:hypothetical protein